MSVPGNDLLSQIENENPKLGIYVRNYLIPTLQPKGLPGHVLSTPADKPGTVELLPASGVVASVNPKSQTYVGTNSSGQIVAAATPVNGITQLTGDVSAGPGSGSQAATVTGVNAAAVPTSQTYIGTNASGQIITAPTPVTPNNTPAIPHEWINSYNASTGVLSQSQPAFSDLSGVAVWAQLPNPPYTAVTATYAILLTDYTVECTSGTFTVTLPSGAALNQRFEITNSGTGVITLAAASGTINGSATQTLNQWDTIDVYWNGANWRIR